MCDLVVVVVFLFEIEHQLVIFPRFVQSVEEGVGGWSQLFFEIAVCFGSH